MPRPKLHRALCDCVDCDRTVAGPGSESSLVVSQDSPPKCLMISTDAPWSHERDRTAEASSTTEDTACLHYVAQRGCCGLVAYREPAEGYPVNALAQVLLQSQSADCLASNKLQVRYNHMQAGFMSSSEALHPVAAEAGMRVLSPHVSSANARGSTPQSQSSDWPNPQAMAQRIVEVIGSPFTSSAQTTDATRSNDEDSKQQDEIDLLMMHVAQPESGQQLSHATLSNRSHHESDQGLQNRASTSSKNDHSDWTSSSSTAELYRWLNEVVSSLLTNTTFKQSVLLVLLLRNASDLSFQPKSDPNVGRDGFPSISKPVQSHCMSNMQMVPLHQTLSSLMVQYLPAVIRQDNVRCLSVSDIQQHGGGGIILAEHILPELAYKLGRAAKYGA